MTFHFSLSGGGRNRSTIVDIHCKRVFFASPTLETALFFTRPCNEHEHVQQRNGFFINCHRRHRREPSYTSVSHSALYSYAFYSRSRLRWAISLVSFFFPFLRSPPRIHAKLNVSSHTATRTFSFRFRWFFTTVGRCAAIQSFTSFHSLLCFFFCLNSLFTFALLPHGRDGTYILRWNTVRVCDSSLIAFFLVVGHVEGLCTITVRIRMYTWNWRDEDFSSCPPARLPTPGKWGRGQKRQLEWAAVGGGGECEI